MPSSASSSVASSSSEDINDDHPIDSKADKCVVECKDDLKEIFEPLDNASADCERPSQAEKKNSEDDSKNESEGETDQLNCETKDATSDEKNHVEAKSSLESERMRVSNNGSQEITSADTQLQEPMAVETLQHDSNSEVVEEVPRPVKEQIAIFANLNIQETHGKPKPGVASAFTSNQNKKSSVLEGVIASKPIPNDTATSNAIVYENTVPLPFGVPEAGSIHQVEQKPTERELPKPDAATFERPQPVDRPSEPPPQPKKFVFKGVTSTPPMTFGVPFGNDNRSVKSAESSVKEVSPSQYLGPEVIAKTSRPPMMIRLRRPGPEAPWGFAVFGGADYGCPPFISRVG